ncbi:N-acyl-D-amino-acid deacylase family protein [Parahaliea mediterranea]|uniref:D-aminoacylase n=1 Tax=Parahaliea mediterranea TaxID=651086 RepID=A0A939DHA2_9GAMM|nr:D-aminoacylase [Parahaliea mediterranea]MBN7798115.1 D-aminoacylase [Parahaliea mediterranea]
MTSDRSRRPAGLRRRLAAAALCLFPLAVPAQQAQVYDVLINNGVIYDGSGAPGVAGDIAVSGDRIVAIGDLDGARAEVVIDAGGRAVAPGFINMLSWGADALIEDGRGLSDIAQGVTLEVFGEGWSMGPLNEPMKAMSKARQTNIRYDIEWNTLGEFLDYLQNRGVSPNIASFVGAATIRVKHLGADNRAPNSEELAAMRADVAQAMEEGAMGVGSALIYPPGSFASTEELIALTDVAGDYGGYYMAHMRSEGDRLLEGVDEMLEIARATGAAVEIYHLKAAGRDNWPKMDRAIATIEAAREAGVDIRANMYTYVAGSTGLSAAMPPWVQEGGVAAWMQRLRDPALRARLLREIENPGENWENVYVASGGADNVMLVGFRKPELRKYLGKTLAEVAELRGQTPAEAIIDLVVEDNSRVEAVYFMMSEDNLRKQIALDWVSFQSDAPVLAPEGVFLEQSVHPRAYGTFARLLGKYVREEQVISLPEALRRLTSLPASNLKIRDRGLLREGYFADIVVFDPDTIQDHATYTEPQQLATGVDHVLVNGVPVLRDGEHTGAKPGRVVRGPGYKRPN